MIDLPALASLRVVASHGSVVAAADALGFTPSAVSQQVKRLERQTGVPLLERVGRGVMLTRHGRHLVEEGSRLLTRSPIVHVDGPLSVRAAFTVAEARQLAERAGLSGATIRRHWPQRFLLSWWKV